MASIVISQAYCNLFVVSVDPCCIRSFSSNRVSQKGHCVH